MDGLEGILLSETSQRKTNTVRSHFYMDPKNKTNEQTKQNENTLIDTESKLVSARGESVGGCVK